MDSLSAVAFDLRKDVLEMIMNSQSGHIGGDMSVMEILVAVYSNMRVSAERADDPDRDRFILSKGHCVEALYAVLAKKGYFDIKEAVETHSKFGSRFIGHPNNKLPGIEMNSGALGHGLSVSVGMALAGKMDGKDYRVYTVMGDGELAEGSVWEAAMSARQYGLDNLCAIVDRNRLQISGCTEDVMGQDDIAERFGSFGWNVIRVKNGNSVEKLQDALQQAEQVKGKPTLLIADTVKGYGSAVMENKAEWHHKVPTDQEYQQILADFNARREMVADE